MTLVLDTNQPNDLSHFATLAAALGGAPRQPNAAPATEKVKAADKATLAPAPVATSPAPDAGRVTIEQVRAIAGTKVGFKELLTKEGYEKLSVVPAEALADLLPKVQALKDK